jgi:ribosomal protein S27AE
MMAHPMSPLFSCPSCGAALNFRPGTMVAVCGYCKALAARKDRNPELLGKVAELVDTGSPLAMGATGHFTGRNFTLAGRVQLKHPLGGVWDEWYLALDDGRWGWLAEAQGRFYLTFTQAPHGTLPSADSLQAGGQADLGPDGQWAVGEVSEAVFHSAEGEIPWAVEPGGRYRFADLSGRNGAFATLDYSEDPPLFFLGRQVELKELGLQGGASKPAKVATQNLNCPHCGGPLALHAPDQTQRVGCPSCGSLLSAENGKLAFLKSLKQPQQDIVIPLGTDGVISGEKVICIGQLRRSCRVDGTDYPWNEYLLLDSQHGFRWLVQSEGHWSLAVAIAPGDCPSVRGLERNIAALGTAWRRFQDVEAVVEGVWGEFYWQVEQGERVQVSEFVAPPRSLTRELQRHPNGGEEVNWSLSSYLEPAEIQVAFKLPGALPAPVGVSSFQPNPHKTLLAKTALWIVAALGLLLLVVLAESITHRNVELFSRQLDLFELTPGLMNLSPGPTRQGIRTRNSPPPRTPLAPVTEPQEPVFFSDPIVIKDGHKNLAFTLRAPVNNTWVGVEGALVSETTGVAELFLVESSYYHGVDGGESWSEGGQADTVFLDAVPPGSYVLRLAPQWDGRVPPVRTIEVQLHQGVMRWLYPGLALLAIVLVPLLMVFRMAAFETRRWQESMYTSSGTDSGGDD